MVYHVLSYSFGYILYQCTSIYGCMFCMLLFNFVNYVLLLLLLLLCCLSLHVSKHRFNWIWLLLWNCVPFSMLHFCFLLTVHLILSLQNAALSLKPGPIVSLNSSIIIIMIINIIVTVITEHLFFHQSHFILVGTVLNVLIRNYDVLIVITWDFVSYFHLTLTFN